MLGVPLSPETLGRLPTLPKIKAGSELFIHMVTSLHGDFTAW